MFDHQKWVISKKSRVARTGDDVAAMVMMVINHIIESLRNHCHALRHYSDYSYPIVIQRIFFVIPLTTIA